MTKQSGIYKITNITTSNIYIGSAVDLKRRLREHRSRLADTRHTNSHLQYSWNKHGESSFQFETVLYCDTEHLLYYEQTLIDGWHPAYNMCPIAGNTLGRKHTDESKQRMSEAKKGEKNNRFGYHHTEETKKKLSEANTGQRHPQFGKHLSEETKRKISDAAKRRWAAIRPL